MRPTYETESDRQHERDVIGLLQEKWKCNAHKNPSKYKVDWSIISTEQKFPSIKAMAEIKWRDKSYPTYHVSFDKYITMVHGVACGLPHLLVIAWPEGGKRVVRYAKVFDGMHSRVVIGGRKDRGDWQDQEPMAEIPMDRFKLVGEL